MRMRGFALTLLMPVVGHQESVDGWFSFPSEGPFQPFSVSILASSLERRLNASESSNISSFGTVGQRHDEREAIALDLLTDLAPQVLALAFVEPDHDSLTRQETLLQPHEHVSGGIPA